MFLKNILGSPQQAEPTFFFIEGTQPQESTETNTASAIWGISWTDTNIHQETFYKQLVLYCQNYEIKKQLNIISQREDNWDGCESKKPTESAIDHAKHTMEELLYSIVWAGNVWLTPRISTDEDGNITAQWYKEERQLHIQIASNSVEYIQVWGPNIDTQMHVDFLNQDNYLTVWEWLING